MYNEGSRRYQDRFDTSRLADRLEERFLSRPTIDEDDRAFIEGCDMLFIATADADGRPQCSYKGGEPGFARVLDERTVAFPNYDGNGMYLTAGNALVNAHVGLLFLDFEQRKRLRLNGVASHSDDDPLLAEYPEAQFLWRVEATEVFPNCPRYIHHYRSSSALASCPGPSARRRSRPGRRATGRTTSWPPTTRPTRRMPTCSSANRLGRTVFGV